jgi:hypothetical protein
MEKDNFDEMIEAIIDKRKPAEMFLRRFLNNCQEMDSTYLRKINVRYVMPNQVPMDINDFIFLSVNFKSPIFAYNKEEKMLFCNCWFFDILRNEFNFTVEEAKRLLKRLIYEYFSFEILENVTTIFIYIAEINVYTKR